MSYAKRRVAAVFSAAAASAISACSTVRQTDPPQTATEQLLVSVAVERAASQLKPAVPLDKKMFLDTQYFDSDGVLRAKYATGEVRDRLLKLGAHLVDDKKDAEVIVEMRSGAQSIDENSLLIGIPSFPIPIPFSGPLTIPEVPFFKIHHLVGVATISVTARKQGDGALVAADGPELGEARRTRVVLLLFSWLDTDLPVQN